MNFDILEQINFITSGLADSYTKLSKDALRSFVERAASFDEGYMEEMGFLEENESASDLIYDEEEAFDYIVGEFLRAPDYRKWKTELIEDLVDDYLEFKYDFLVSKGLVE